MSNSKKIIWWPAIILVLLAVTPIFAGYTGDFVKLISTGVLSWNGDTGISRVSTTTVAVGNATQADASVSVGTAGLTYSVTASTSSPIALPGTSTHSNSGSSVDIIFNLPLAPPTGTSQTFVVVAAHYVKAQAPNGVKIYLGTNSSATGGYVRSTLAGSTLTLVYDGTEWVKVSLGGTWTIDT